LHHYNGQNQHHLGHLMTDHYPHHSEHHQELHQEHLQEHHR
jgi:hypothetical protein